MTNQTYEETGYDNFLTRKKPVVLDTESTTSIKLPQLTGENLITDVPVSSINTQINKTVKRSPLSTASGTINNGAGAYLSSTLSIKSSPDAVILAICEVTCYMDSIAATSIVPYGSNAISAGHHLFGWYDYRINETNTKPGYHLTYNFHVHNGTGSNHTYYFYIKWRYFGIIDDSLSA